ncbi:DnaA ATPase domain-containing protein [Cellulosimicrobium cellulans]|uniref:DnaA ATPase domain-containing protein n=1 Tax=Cellulosimicrobium cellulans TaxID=1710 RepID=UPI0035D8CEF8
MGPIDPTNRPLTKEERQLAIELRRRREERDRRAAEDEATAGPRRLDIDAWARQHGDSPAARIRARMAEDPEYAAQVDAMMLADDERDREQLQRTQRRNRFNLYASNRPSIYSTATYADLDPTNGAQRTIAGWWKSGAKSLVIAGEPGRGKTHGAYAICNEVAAADRDGTSRLSVSVRAYTAADIRGMLVPLKPHELRDDVRSRERTATERSLYEVDLLLIDDITAVKVTEWFRESVHKILDQRIANDRRTIVTMNGPSLDGMPDYMVETFGAPIVSRLRDQAIWTWLDGVDRRQKATFDNPFLRG